MEIGGNITFIVGSTHGKCMDVIRSDVMSCCAEIYTNHTHEIWMKLYIFRWDGHNCKVDRYINVKDMGPVIPRETPSYNFEILHGHITCN